MQHSHSAGEISRIDLIHPIKNYSCEMIDNNYEYISEQYINTIGHKTIDFIYTILQLDLKGEITLNQTNYQCFLKAEYQPLISSN